MMFLYSECVSDRIALNGQAVYKSSLPAFFVSKNSRKNQPSDGRFRQNQREGKHIISLYIQGTCGKAILFQAKVQRRETGV